MTFTKVRGRGVTTTDNYTVGVITATKFVGPITGNGGGIQVGLLTATGLDINGDADISGNLTVGGDFTTLNTTLREVELLHVDANSTATAGIITQRGSGDILKLFDTTTEVLTVVDGGNIGIGTDTPIGKLHLNYNGNNGISFRMENHEGYSSLHNDSGALHLDSGFHLFRNEDGSSEFLRITSTGANIVGVTTTTSRLDVGNNGTSAVDLRFRSNRASAGQTIANLNYEWNGTTVAQIRGIAGSDTTNKDDAHLAFFTTPAGSGSFNERLRITSAGDVNIGNAGGTAAHHASGLFNGVTPKFEVKLGSSSNSYTRYVNIMNPGAQTGSETLGRVGIKLSLGSEASSGESNKSGAIYAESTSGYNNGTALCFATSNSERLRIDSSGRLLVGTDVSPASANTLLRVHTPISSSSINSIEITHNTNGADKAGAALGLAIGNGGASTNAADLYFSTATNGSLTQKLWIRSDGHITPAAAGTQDLGSASKEWGDLYFANSKGLKLGSSQVGDLYNDGTDTYFRNSASNGQMLLRSDGNILISNYAANEYRIKTFNNGAVELYYDQSAHTTAKLATTATGVSVHGEVAASQDYPNYRPLINWNFAATKKLDSRLTYTRTGPASYIDEYGKVVLVGDNVPRFDHDPLTGECKGLLIETGRTNQWLQSVTLADYVTGGNLQGGITLTNAGTSTKDPTGGYNATKMASGNSGGAHSLFKNFTSGSNGNSHTFSCWVKAAGANHARIYVDSVGGNMQGPGVTFSTGNTWNVAASGVGTQVATSAVEYPNGWWRLSVTGSFSNRNDYYCHIDIEGGEGDISYNGNGSNGIYVWGVQFENGGFPTSYTPTYGAAAPRGTDFAYLDGTVGTEFDDIYDPEQGTFVIDWFNNPNGNFNDGYVFAMDDGSGNNRIAAVNSNNYQITAVVGGTSQGTRDLGSINSGKNKIAFTYKHNDQATSLNGSDASVDTSSAVPSFTGSKYWWFGLRQGAYDLLGGYISNFSYYPRRLTNTQLKNLSS